VDEADVSLGDVVALLDCVVVVLVFVCCVAVPKDDEVLEDVCCVFPEDEPLDEVVPEDDALDEVFPEEEALDEVFPEDDELDEVFREDDELEDVCWVALPEDDDDDDDCVAVDFDEDCCDDCWVVLEDDRCEFLLEEFEPDLLPACASRTPNTSASTAATEQSGSTGTEAAPETTRTAQQSVYARASIIADLRYCKNPPARCKMMRAPLNTISSCAQTMTTLECPEIFLGRCGKMSPNCAWRKHRSASAVRLAIPMLVE
jgi:hypothetical protein